MKALPLAFALYALLWGCGETLIAPSSASGKPKASPTAIPPATQSSGKAPSITPGAATALAGGLVMAYVKGQPIYMSELNDLLVQGYGLGVSRQLIATELVRQAAAEKGITASDKEVQAEKDQTIRDMFPSVEQASQREKLLEQVLLAQKGMSHQQWQMVMRRNVLLRKLAEPEVKVSEDDLRDEFAQQYGRRVEVRHIQTDSLSSAQDILRQLHDGADFAELAKKVSTNPSSSDGGLLPIISANTPNLPLAIRQVAMAMKKPGKISDPVQVETAFHILKLERIIEPENVKFIDVKEKLVTAVKERRLSTIKQQILQDLIRKSQESGQIQYVDPTLKAQSHATDEASRQEP